MNSHTFKSSSNVAVGASGIGPSPGYNGGANVAPDLGLGLDGSAMLDDNRMATRARPRQQRADGVNTRIVGRLRSPYSMSIHSARTRPASQDRSKSIDGQNPGGEAAGARHAFYRHRLWHRQHGRRHRSAGRADARGPILRDRELSDIYRSVLCFEHLEHYDTASHAGMN